jgi:hypothetical protein
MSHAASLAITLAKILVAVDICSFLSTIKPLEFTASRSPRVGRVQLAGCPRRALFSMGFYRRLSRH